MWGRLYSLIETHSLRRAEGSEPRRPEDWFPSLEKPMTEEERAEALADKIRRTFGG